MNKGLEVIEAHELFFVPYERIDVVVHPSRSSTRWSSSSTARPSPSSHSRHASAIGYACATQSASRSPSGRSTGPPPRRSPSSSPTVRLCLPRSRVRGGPGRRGAPAWLNAANEVAVAAFLESASSGSTSQPVVAETLGQWDRSPLAIGRDVLALTPPPGAARPRRWPGARGRDDALFAGRPGNVGVLVTTLATPRPRPRPLRRRAPRRARGRLVRLLGALALITGVFLVLGLGDLLLVLAVIIVMVMVHEFGTSPPPSGAT